MACTMHHAPRERAGEVGIVRFFLFILLICSVSAVASTSLDKANSKSISGLGSNGQKSLQEYLIIQEVVKSILPKVELDNQAVALKMKLQDERIKGLEREISRLSKPEENSIATVLLSAVSVIITVLGVLIAVLAILGYRNIKKEAIKDSRRTARETVKTIVKEEIPRETEGNIIKLIEDGKFDRLIQNAVENIVYRDTSMLDNVADGDGLP